jgi:hypothetical protein
MLKRTRATGLVLSFLFAAAASVYGQHSRAYQETVAEIMARQEIADFIAGPRWIKPRLLAPRENVASNPSSPASATFPAGAVAVAAPAPSAPQTIGVNFLGAQLSDTNGFFPPDTMGAAGPTQFLVGVNGRIRTFAKSSGGADGALDADMDVFFSSVRNGQPTSDPRVRYDRLSGRWIVTIINFNVSFSNNRLLIAVSDSGTITGSTVWTYYFFQHNLDSPVGDTNLFLDYDTLGVDSNALVIGGNIFDTAGNFQGTSVHVVRKSAVVSGGGGDLVPSGNVVAFRNLTGSPTGPGPYSPQGVDELADAAATDSWVAGVDNATFGTLMLRKITFSAPGAWPPSGISANLSLTVPATAFPLAVPHQGNAGGSGGQLDALDDRLFEASLRGGHIWAAHNIAVTSAGVGDPAGDRDGSRWYEIDVSGVSPSLVQSGTLYDSAASNPRFYWIPSIAVSGQGHAAIGTSASATNARINAATAGRLAGDTSGTLQTPLLYTSSSTSYNPPADPGPPRRWGDYSYTSLDPNDDMTLWTIQEYCNAVDSYGVRVAQLIAPPPATPVSAAPPSVMAAASVDVVVSGTSTSGSGFYDPGSSYPSRIAASVSGGDVTVSGVTYTDPTSLTLHLNTLGAVPGSRTITVTNPDGQAQTSAPGVLTILSGGPPPAVSSIAPSSGPAGSGTEVSISGSNFSNVPQVSIGGVPASGVTGGGPTTIAATTPLLSPGTLNDVTVTNPDGQSGTLPKGWMADFLDVPQADIFHSYVEKLFRNGVTAGCGGGNYCRDNPVRRDQMAVFLLKAKLTSGYIPPACTGIFPDVPCPSLFADWIEDLFARGITAGCGGGDYCPANPVTRAQMAVFLLKADLGSGYTPPACAGIFGDVACPSQYADWIEDLYNRTITAGCQASPPLYCPDNPNTRGQMAVFLVKTFNLP